MAIAMCSYCVGIEKYVLSVQGADLALAELSLAGLASEGLTLVSGLAAAKNACVGMRMLRWHVGGPAKTSSRSFATLRICVKFCYLHLVGFSLSACQPVVHVLCHISGLLQLPCDQQIETVDAVTAMIVLIALTCFSSAKGHTLNSSDMLWACSMLQSTFSWQALGFRTSEMPNVAHDLLLIMESRNS